MISHTAECPNCFEIITDPICINCYTKHISYWLNDNFSNTMAKEIIMKNLLRVLSTESLNDNKCILCGNNAIDLCSYCFSIKASSVLTKLNIPDSFVEDFEFLFTDKFFSSRDSHDS